MSDNRTTELLPCPCCDSESIKEFAPDEWGDIANPYWKIKCMECGLTMCGTNRRMNQEAWNTRTPEQAIAATLGGGKLTADDIRDLIERHSVESGGNRRDFHNGAYVAIADELNAKLGSGTCETEARS